MSHAEKSTVNKTESAKAPRAFCSRPRYGYQLRQIGGLGGYADDNGVRWGTARFIVEKAKP